MPRLGHPPATSSHGRANIFGRERARRRHGRVEDIKKQGRGQRSGPPLAEVLFAGWQIFLALLNIVSGVSYREVKMARNSAFLALYGTKGFETLSLFAAWTCVCVFNNAIFSPDRGQWEKKLFFDCFWLSMHMISLAFLTLIYSQKLSTTTSPHLSSFTMPEFFQRPSSIIIIHFHKFELPKPPQKYLLYTLSISIRFDKDGRYLLRGFLDHDASMPPPGSIYYDIEGVREDREKAK